MKEAGDPIRLFQRGDTANDSFKVAAGITKFSSSEFDLKKSSIAEIVTHKVLSEYGFRSPH